MTKLEQIVKDAAEKIGIIPITVSTQGVSDGPDVIVLNGLHLRVYSDKLHFYLADGSSYDISTSDPNFTTRLDNLLLRFI